MSIMMAAAPPPRSLDERRRPLPPWMATRVPKSARRTMAPRVTPARVMKRVSRLAMWPSSWATTPWSSSRLSLRGGRWYGDAGAFGFEADSKGVGDGVYMIRGIAEGGGDAHFFDDVVELRGVCVTRGRWRRRRTDSPRVMLTRSMTPRRRCR